MTTAWLFDVGLALLVLAIASWTIAVRDAFAAVIGFVVYGLLLALVWVRLAAVDVALTEAAIGGGLAGTLLLGAAARLGACEVSAPSSNVPARPPPIAAWSTPRRPQQGHPGRASEKPVMSCCKCIAHGDRPAGNR